MILLFAAGIYSWIWTLTFTNRVYIYRHRAEYQQNTFRVTGADHFGDEGMEFWWLAGTVSGNEETLVPKHRGVPRPRSEDELLKRYPKGTAIPVLYNPGATETFVQGESLRVLEMTPDFWSNEEALRHKLAWRVLLPVPTLLGIKLFVRLLNRRRATNS